MTSDPFPGSAGRACEAGALGAAAAALVVGGWLDGTVIVGLERDGAATYAPTGAAFAVGLGAAVVAGCVLAVGVLAWRSRSVLVGIVYLAVGLWFAFLPYIAWQFATQINGAPPLLPGPVADAVNRLQALSAGPLDAVETIGAGMALAGALVVGAAIRRRATRASGRHGPRGSPGP